MLFRSIDKPIAEFPEIPMHKGRIKVEVDRVGGGGGGLTSVESEALQRVATEAKQDALIAELEKKTDPTDVQLSELIPVLRALILAIANPAYVDKSANAIRNQVQSGTITTLTNLTNINGNIGSFSADHLQRQANITAWAANVRNLIT